MASVPDLLPPELVQAEAPTIEQPLEGGARWTVLLVVLAVVQLAWLGLLGYAFIRFVA